MTHRQNWTFYFFDALSSQMVIVYGIGCGLTLGFHPNNVILTVIYRYFKKHGNIFSLHITFQILVYGVCPLFFYNVIFLTAAGGRKIWSRCVECDFVIVFVLDIVIYL